MSTLRMKDIAAEAGVSVTAVSFFLNGKAKRYGLSTSTCDRISRTVEKHHFSPNFQAKAVKSGRTYLIGMVINAVHGSFWMDVISGIEERIEKAGYHLILVTLRGSVSREERVVRFLFDKGADGFIYVPQVISNAFHLAQLLPLANEKPLVAINANMPQISSVCTNEWEGGYLAAAHFLQKGHRRLAYIGSLAPYMRGQAFRTELSHEGLACMHFETVSDFMPHARQFSGVFCFSDFLVLELYDKARQLNLRIPEELSVIGYDDMHFASCICPPLTTIRQLKKEIGIEAAELLLARLETPTAECIPPAKSILPVSLIARDSVFDLTPVNCQA